MKNRFSEKFLLFLKGFLMGVCDLIPGISGGTIAFITGIYEQLIDSVSSIPTFFYDFFKYLTKREKENLDKLKKDMSRVNIGFLLILLGGIISAFLLVSGVIKFLLDNYLSYTIAFFIGLVLASSKIIFDHIENHNLKNILFGVFGFIIGILFSILIPMNIENPSMYYVFIGGFVAVSAMFLPGISGAFILLVLGLYGFMINILHNIAESLDYLLVFIVGVVLGAFVISRIIMFLFEKDRCKTLYFLLGLVIGALSIPLKKIYTGLEILDVSIILGFILLGILSVAVINSSKFLIKKGVN